MPHLRFHSHPNAIKLRSTAVIYAFAVYGPPIVGAQAHLAVEKVVAITLVSLDLHFGALFSLHTLILCHFCCQCLDYLNANLGAQSGQK
jgi:hypothetical protein